MTERSTMAVSAARMLSAAGGLTESGAEISEIRARLSACVQAALTELPRHAQTVRSATGRLLEGLRGL